MRQIISFIARADLTVTVEGWMLHAAYLLGKPFRVLMLADSHHEGWRPWGGS
jgi:ADP-heptose:LPS heptosyltransferase